MKSMLQTFVCMDQNSFFEYDTNKQRGKTLNY